jgi:hypothetical protein
VVSGGGRIAGNGAGEGDLPPRKESRAARRGELAAAVDENEERRDEGLLLGGFIFDRDSGVDATVVPKLDGIGGTATASGNSDVMVIVDPASDTVEERRATEGRTMLNEGAREFLISMMACGVPFPERSLLAGWIVRVLFLWLTECTCTVLLYADE